MRTECASARDCNGRRFGVGATVRLLGPLGRAVRVVKMWKQGYDGTQVQTEPSPSEEYPHHFQERASNLELVGTNGKRKAR